MNAQTRIIILAAPEHPLERKWDWRSTRIERADRFIGRGLLSGEDFATLKKGDEVVVAGIGRAVVQRIESGRSNFGGQPWALFDVVDEDARAGRELAVELEAAEADARRRWVPRPPAPKKAKPLRRVEMAEGMRLKEPLAHHFTDGEVMLAAGEVCFINGMKMRVTKAIARVPDGACTCWAEAVI